MNTAVSVLWFFMISNEICNISRQANKYKEHFQKSSFCIVSVNTQFQRIG